MLRCVFSDEQRDDRRGVAEFHRPSERVECGRAGIRARRFVAERARRRASARPYQAVAEQSRQPTVLPFLLGAGRF